MGNGTNFYNSDWNEERLALLSSLAVQGSNAWIAQQINAQTGSKFSRSAIIAKKHRKGIPSVCGPRECAGQQLPRKPRKRKAAPNWFISGGKESKSADLAYLLKVESAPQPAEFLGLELSQLKKNQCRYPRGTKAPYLFCGQATEKSQSYCASCRLLCYDTPRTRALRATAAVRNAEMA